MSLVRLDGTCVAPGRRGIRGWAGARAFLDLSPDALGAAHAGRGRPAKFDVGFWLDYFRAHPRRRGLPERRRLRGLLPDTGSVPPPQRVAGRPRRVRRARRRLRRAGHGAWWRGPTRTPPTTTSGGAPGLDRGGRRRAAAASLGLPGDVGHVRAGPVQLRVHDRGDAARSCRATGSTASSSTAGTASGMCYCEHCRSGTSARPAAWTCRGARRPAGPGAARLHRSGGRSGCSRCGGCGTRGPQGQPRRAASSPTPAAAPPARST